MYELTIYTQSTVKYIQTLT